MVKMNTYTTQWYRAEIYFFLVSAIILLTGAVVGGTFLLVRPPLPVLILTLLIGVVVLAGLVGDYKQKKGRLVKLFYVRREAAIEVIEGVLHQKGVPFQEINRPFKWNTIKVYQLDNDLTVHLRSYHDRYNNRGVMVEVGPISKVNRPLVQSLQEKIDDAFAPRGLA
jgi:hypothetical protein